MNYLDFEEGQLFIFIRDITDRKQPEEALRASEEKFRSIVENATDFIHI